MKLKKVVFNRFAIAFATLLITSLLMAYFTDIISLIVNFIEKYIVSDHQVRPSSRNNLIGVLALSIMILIAFSIDLIFDIHNKLLLILKPFIKFEDLSNFFLTDKLCTKRGLSKKLFFVGVIFGLFVYFDYLVYGIKEDGFIETSCTLFLLFSAFILIFSGIRFRHFLPKDSQKIFLFSLALLVLVILMLFGEEISWGQTYLHWKTTGVFEEYNFQDETNIHNFLNPLFKFIYPVAGMVFFLFLFLFWFFSKKEKSFLFNLLIPHQSLFFMAFLMACSSFVVDDEVFEDQLELFILLYSIRIFMCLKFPAITSKSKKMEVD